MKFRYSLIFLAALPLVAEVKFDAGSGMVTIDGKPFAEFHAGKDVGKPFIAPIRSANGKLVTRQFPMEKVQGESRDHVHHRGLWFSYDDVNGVKFWENDPSYTKPNMGKILVTKVTSRDGAKSATVNMLADWNDTAGKTIMMEDRKMTFHAIGDAWVMDFDVALKAPEKVTFGDTKEGAFAFRLADSIAEKNGGKMVNAEGMSGMAKVWGHKSKWVDYTGDVDGEKLGIAMIDHPKNPGYPTYWHSRDYGLFALDPFGAQAFDKNQPENHMTIEAGQSMRFRWRVVVHSGSTDPAQVDKWYEDFAKH